MKQIKDDIAGKVIKSKDGSYKIAWKNGKVQNLNNTSFELYLKYGHYLENWAAGTPKFAYFLLDYSKYEAKLSDNLNNLSDDLASLIQQEKDQKIKDALNNISSKISSNSLALFDQSEMLSNRVNIAKNSNIKQQFNRKDN